MNLLLQEFFKYLFLFLIYFFLYKVITIILKDISEPGSKKKYHLLLVKSEEDLPSLEKEIFLSPPVKIGKGPHNDIVIDSSYISNDHIRIFYRGENLWIEDLKSTNGTVLNEKPLKKPSLLKKEDMIDLGGAFIFKIKEI